MDYFEDLTVGETDSFGRYEVTAEEIVEFAGQYDPQPFHTDPDAASGTSVDGLIASGWHTAAMTMRLLVDNALSDIATRAALGVDELRWRRPVQPGDALSVEVELVAKRDWDEKAGLSEIEIRTYAGETLVQTMVALVLVNRRSWDAE